MNFGGANYLALSAVIVDAESPIVVEAVSPAIVVVSVAIVAVESTPASSVFGLVVQAVNTSMLLTNINANNFFIVSESYNCFSLSLLERDRSLS